jgi:DNA mismatch endonuclease (patch repair protein)
MADVFTKAKRSEVMSRIGSRGNKNTEVALARLMRRHGITGWRRQRRLRVGELRVERRARQQNSQHSTFNTQLTVRPDFVFLKLRTVIFVDGCFWHGCPRHGTRPRGNAAFWRRKLASNRARDGLVTRTLRRSGWRVLRVWEHELAKIRLSSTPHPGPLPVRGGEGARNEARLVARLRREIIRAGV